MHGPHGGFHGGGPHGFFHHPEFGRPIINVGAPYGYNSQFYYGPGYYSSPMLAPNVICPPVYVPPPQIGISTPIGSAAFRI